MHQRIGNDGQVRALQRRAQIGARRALASAAAPGLLHPTDAVLPAMRQTVDVLAVFEADLLPGLNHLLAEERLVGGARGQERAFGAMELVLAGFPAFGLFEIG